MEQLDRLHQGGCERLGKTKPFTLRNRKRARIRADSDGDWNPDSIDPRQIAQTGDADLPRFRREASQRVIRRDRPVRSTLEHLQNGAVETLGKAGNIRTLHGRQQTFLRRDRIATSSNRKSNRLDGPGVASGGWSCDVSARASAARSAAKPSMSAPQAGSCDQMVFRLARDI